MMATPSGYSQLSIAMSQMDIEIVLMYSIASFPWILSTWPST